MTVKSTTVFGIIIRYAKEPKKEKEASGTGGDEVGKEWEYFQLISFLKDFIKQRK